jgi:proteasome lid subunit RPN8/RPN11
VLNAEVNVEVAIRDMNAEVKAAAAHAATLIDDSAIEHIRLHGAETFPHECCGGLVAVDGRIVEAFSLDNTTTEGAARRFRVSADDYRQAEKRASARGGTLAGFYHSHPNEPARPSAYDLAHAWPNFVYVIISVRDRVPGDITVWHLRDDRSAFDEGELRWPTGS